MSKELKRVPLNFEWPLNQIWRGYRNPHYEGHCSNCPDCNGRGSTLALQRLQDLVFLLLMSPGDVRQGRCHPYFQSTPLNNTRGIVVSADIAELTAGLAGRKGDVMFGHDARDNWAATKTIVKAAGLNDSWGTCPRCKGEGTLWDSAKNKRRAESWRRKEPPNGEGFQIWETVSDGAPISPVFASPEDLAEWMATPGHGWESDQGTTREQWLRFINGTGWAPSLMSGPAGVVSGIQAVTG